MDYDLKTARVMLGWSQQFLALKLCCAKLLIQRWEAEKYDTPPSILRWINRLAKHHERNPAPTDWRVRK